MGLVPNANELEAAAEKLVDHARDTFIPVLCSELEQAVKKALDGLEVTVCIKVKAKEVAP